MNELKNRGVVDILIAVVDGLKGFPEAINAVFPEAIVQTCIVHLIRNSMSFASWKERKFIAQALRGVYRAETPEAGMAALEAFEEGPLGTETPGHRHELAAALGPGDPVFRFSRGRPSDHLYYQRHRGAEFEDPSCRPYPRPFPR